MFDGHICIFFFEMEKGCGEAAFREVYFFAGL